MIKEIDKCEKNLNIFFEANNMQQFSIAVHGMKGSLANIGAMELSSMALALESASKQFDTVYCAENLTSFLEGLHSLNSQLKEAFSLICQSNSPVEIPPDLALIYKQLLNAFGKFDLLRIEKEISALGTLHLNGTLKEDAEKIKDFVMMMDYDSATELIKKAA
jgi:HPt (histidine-containing phosphotransfer) domain-containing protein